ncbi:hypothetical protein [Vibrio algicola]|uniref:Uncharacterized protein n=1 Tax=Vibrio algicola TaxID=2662262 RepID=A0A5Q0TNJ2_9VIBR|nr:hypothetical protein [Vibrio algicola]
MSKQLFDKSGKEVPERPAMDNDDVRLLVINNAVEALFKGKYCPFEYHEREELLETLIAEYSDYDDEYALAKKFEDYGWDVNRDFVNNLECVTGEISSSLNETIKAWFDAYQPIPPYSTGTQITVISFNGKETGVIESIYEYDQATYTVKLDNQLDSDTSRRLIKFEDATLAE